MKKNYAFKLICGQNITFIMKGSKHICLCIKY